MGDVERRARVHAALGEPVRLAVVDRLGLGDLSPGALGADLGLPTNLLAHHLRVLEEAGVVRRARSEADRRRSYVQLVLDDPVVAALTGSPQAPSTLPAAERVVFVCTRNSARSQLAAAAWREVSQLPAASAGTHPAGAVHPGAVAVGRRHGLGLEGARTSVLHDVVRDGDLVVAVCDNAYEELVPAHQRPHLHWAVPDPVRAGTGAAFEAAYTQLTQRIGRLAEAVSAAA